MPSYRVRMVVGDLRDGVDPATVLPAAAAVRRAVVGRTDELVEVEVSRVYRRYGPRWYPLR